MVKADKTWRRIVENSLLSRWASFLSRHRDQKLSNWRSTQFVIWWVKQQAWLQCYPLSSDSISKSAALSSSLPNIAHHIDCAHISPEKLNELTEVHCTHLVLYMSLCIFCFRLCIRYSMHIGNMNSVQQRTYEMNRYSAHMYIHLYERDIHTDEFEVNLIGPDLATRHCVQHSQAS